MDSQASDASRDASFGSAARILASGCVGRLVGIGFWRSIVYVVVAVTYPLLFCTAVALTPWHELVEAFHPANLITITATVIALVATGYDVGRFLKTDPIETAIVNACHSGLGGTGGAMILAAAERMELMPFARVSTRIGGALTVTAAIVAMAHFKVL